MKVYLDDDRIFGLKWEDDESFFHGEIVFNGDSSGVKIYSETMGKEFVKKILCQWVDDGELKE